MRFFSTLSLLASLTFVGLSAAAPHSDHSDGGVALGNTLANGTPGADQVTNDASLGGIVGGYRAPRGAGDVAAEDRGRRGEPNSLPLIILGLSTQIAPLCKRLGTLVAVEATVEVITPIVDEIKVALAAACVEVAALRDQPIEYVLYFSGRVLSIQEVGQIVASLIILIYTAISGVLAVVQVAYFKLVLALLVELSFALAGLLCVVFEIVGGLQVVVVVLIEEIIPDILNVNCTYLIATLGINP